MSHPHPLSLTDISSFLASYTYWKQVDHRGAAAFRREFSFPDFSQALAFVVRVGLYAERVNHHPDLELRWGSVVVLWSTHDVGGLSQRDLAAAKACEEMV